MEKHTKRNLVLILSIVVCLCALANVLMFEHYENAVPNTSQVIETTTNTRAVVAHGSSNSATLQVAGKTTRNKTKRPKSSIQEAKKKHNNTSKSAKATKKNGKKKTITKKGSGKKYANYYGTLSVPGVSIKVDLYSGYSQQIVDRKNSAACFSYPPFDGLVIADHNYQAFAQLNKVRKGTAGYITLKSGKKLKIKCIAVKSGTNTKNDLIDSNGRSLLNGCDYVMYTCKNGSKSKVYVTKWNKV